MKYKVIEDFGSARKGDMLVEDEYGLVSFYIEEDDNTRSMSMDYDTADFLCEEEKLVAIEERSADSKVKDAVELIDTLLETYAKDHKLMTTAASKGAIQPCVKVEAETVYYNLTKVLDKIKEELTNE